MQDKRSSPQQAQIKQAQSAFNDYQKLQSSKISRGSSSSKNKLFVRKPTSKRTAFNSPNFIKKQSVQLTAHNNKLMFNEEYKKNLNESKSDQNIRDLKFYMKYSINTKKNSISKERNQNIYSSRQIKEAYFGETIHPHTQAALSCKIDTGSSQNSEKDLFFGEKPKVSQNKIINTSHKKTRTQYFRQEDHKSQTSRSNKQKQIDFIKARLQFNPQAYTGFLEDNVKRLQTSNHALNKKSKWMQEQIQMHLEKQYIMDAQKSGIIIQNKNLKQEIRRIKEQRLCLQKQNQDLMKKTKKTDRGSNSSLSSLENNQQIQSYRMFKKLDIVSLLDVQVFNSFDPQAIKKQVQIQELQNQRRQFRQQANKKIGQLQKNIFWKQLQIQSLKKEADHYQEIIKANEKDFQIYRTTIDVLKENIVELEIKNSQNQEKIENLVQRQFQFQTQNKMLSEQISVLKATKASSQQNFLKQMKKYKETHFQKDILSQNPMKLMSSNSQNLQDENVALKQYIGRILQQYKYLKIENRMLQKLKQQLAICQKQKKQLKQQRDMFKKKVMQNLKANSRRMMLDSSQASQDSIFELSSEINPNQNFQ